ncbi:hypothetical protein BX600DRAFT_452908 [Xylariales sp. PMI_506]|nr:hypothetical protein BX600DRAFT_452908 [Xylariales sp. PMI_506]
MVKATIAFRSKPISSRLPQTRPTKPQALGPFRYFDLPPELRNDILTFLIQGSDLHRDVLHLFLTSKRMYSEAASIFYYEVILDTTQSQGRPDLFLTGPTSLVSPRRHVHSLRIMFYVKDHIHLFHELYAGAIKDMVERGRLQHLHLCIASRFPSSDFWGGVGAGGGYAEEVKVILLSSSGASGGVGKKGQQDKEITAPIFVTKPPFQNFLRFLAEAQVQQLRLFVDGLDHHQFWCRFHRAHPSGRQCNGEWKGKARTLRIKWKEAVACLRGAQLAKQAH